MTTIDINCDLGEHYGRWTLGDDLAILPYVSSANIACGFHAGDPLHILKTIEACIQHGVSIGAHPSFPDLQGFGRRKMQLEAEEIYSLVLYQTSALQGMVHASGDKLRHVKPHGALYNMAAADVAMAIPIARAISDLDAVLSLVGPPNSALEQAAKQYNLHFIREGFMDRAYLSNGQLADRKLPDAVYSEMGKVIEQALSISLHQQVTSIEGNVIPLQADTLCLHGDTPGAVGLAKKLRETLKEKGVVMKVS
jgi:UPF0271 protein